jgi:hypothetical protein
VPGGVEVNHEFEFPRPLDRQIGGLGTLENPSDICAADAAEQVWEVRVLAHQTAHANEIAEWINHRQLMRRSQRHDFLAVPERKRTNNQSLDSAVRELGDSSLEFKIATTSKSRRRDRRELGRDCRNWQTFAASPAEPGDLLGY